MSTPLVISVTDELVAELEALASKATPGNWATDGDTWVCANDSDQLNNGFVLAICEGPDKLKNAEYMAKASPLVIRALLAERAELKRDAERYRWLRDKALISTETAPAILLVNDCCEPAVNCRGWQSAIYGKDADVYVDAAMQSEAKQ
jgi:hypothetical protein